jgi:putative solute:sodium symporter small subunit
MRELSRHPYWQRSKNPLLVLLGLWIAFSAIVQLYVSALNKITVPVLGMPLGMYIAVQGSLVVFVIAVVWLARRRV